MSFCNISKPGLKAKVVMVKPIPRLHLRIIWTCMESFNEFDGISENILINNVAL